MPSHFDRFRLLNEEHKDLGGVRFRNESDKPVTLNGDYLVHVYPGTEAELPPVADGNIIIDVETPS